MYGSKRFFYEDSEVLTNAIVDYAAAIREPREMEDRLRRARAKLSEVEVDGKMKGHAKLSSAQRALAKAKEAMGRSVMMASYRRINEARAVMVAAREAIERDYYVIPLDRVETSPPNPYTAGMGGGERKSDSNRQELKPSNRPRV